MDPKEIERIIKAVAKTISSACEATLMEVDGKIVTIRCIYDGFGNKTSLERFDFLSDKFEQYGTNLAKNYILVFETWKKQEFINYSNSKNEDGNTTPSGIRRFAAKDNEL